MNAPGRLIGLPQTKGFELQVLLYDVNENKSEALDDSFHKEFPIISNLSR